MTTKHAPKKTLDILGLILIVVPLLFQFGLISFEMPYQHSILMLLCIAAVALSVKGFNQPNVAMRVLSILVVIAGTILTFVNLFKILD